MLSQGNGFAGGKRAQSAPIVATPTPGAAGAGEPLPRARPSAAAGAGEALLTVVSGTRNGATIRRIQHLAIVIFLLLSSSSRFRRHYHHHPANNTYNKIRRTQISDTPLLHLMVGQRRAPNTQLVPASAKLTETPPLPRTPGEHPSVAGLYLARYCTTATNTVTANTATAYHHHQYHDHHCHHNHYYGRIQ